VERAVATLRRERQRRVDAGLIEPIREGAGLRPAIYALTRLIEIADGR
jgi:hypothetical protein